jgi:chorismate-pyruvate lyase
MLRCTRTILLLASLLATAVHAEPAYEGWQDTPVVRLKTLALLQTLNATLLSNSSATASLAQWCGEHHMAAEARIRAIRDVKTIKPADGEIRQQLQVGADEPVGYRRVQLACGEHVLSEADNWYVPARLTPEMNHVLDTSDTPFGTAVRALNFTRKTESVRLLWSPLPAGWENAMPPATDAKAALDIPEYVLQHRAVLYKDGNVPFSLVVETYRRDIFAFPLSGGN